MNSTRVLYIYLILICLLFIGIIFFSKKSEISNGEYSRINFMNFFIAIGSVVYIAFQEVGGFEKFNLTGRILSAIAFSFCYCIAIVFADYMRILFEKRGKDIRAQMLVVETILAMGAIFSFVTCLNGHFLVSKDGELPGGTFFKANQLFAFTVVGIFIFIILKNREGVEKFYLGCFLSYLLYPLIALLLQTRIRWIFLLYPAFVLSMIQLFLIAFMTENIELEKEIYQNKIDIMMAEIRPHFIFNSLTAIYGLCDKEPRKAKKAISSFSDYLRSNLESLKMKPVIDFNEELNHIEAYLDLELLRYGDSLNVVYHIETMEFKLPALCIQPLVENGIKHGIAKKDEGGVIFLTTHEERDAIVITIEDTGIGFDKNEVKNDDNSHIGIENVRKRLNRLCGGTLTVESEKGRGTVATVRIPISFASKQEDNVN